MRVALLLALAACSRASQGSIAIDKADALWGGDAFCARTALGLACWTMGTEGVARGPAIVAGVRNVTEVAIAGGEACALHDGDVTCFVPGAVESRGRSFDQPMHIAAIAPATLCAVHASGVSCWTADQVATARPELSVTAARGADSATDGRFTCVLDRAGAVACRE